MSIAGEPWDDEEELTYSDFPRMGDCSDLEQRVADLEQLAKNYDGHLRAAVQVLEGYRHLDKVLSDERWLPDDFRGQLLYDFWKVIKSIGQSSQAFLTQQKERKP